MSTLTTYYLNCQAHIENYQLISVRVIVYHTGLNEQHRS